MLDEEGFFLLRKSSLTRTQFDAFIVKMIKKEKISSNIYEELSKKFRTRGAMMGSFIQAKGNIEKSLYTLLLLFYLGIWKEKEWRILNSLIKGVITMANSNDTKRKEIRRYVEKIINVMI
jgi:ribosomal protein L17